MGITLSKFAADMSKASSLLGNWGRQAESLGRTLTDSISRPLMQFGQQALKSSGEFESAMFRVEAKLGLAGDASAAAMKQLEALALQLGRDTVFSAGEAAGAMENLVTAGFSVEQIMSVLPAVLNLASTENMGLEEASRLTSAALKGFGFEAADAGRVVDILAKASLDSATSAADLGQGLKTVGPVAAGFKLDFTEIVAILQAMAEAGIEGGRAGTALASAIASLAKPVGEGKAAIEEMNLRIFDSPGVMRPMKDILEDIGKVADPTTAALRIFGKESGPEMIAAMNQGIPKIREFEEGLKDAGGTAERVGQAQMRGFQGALEALRGSWETLGIVIGKSGFLQWMTDAIRKVTEFVNSVAEQKPEMLKPWVEFAAFLAATGPVLMGLGLVAKAFGPSGLLVRGLKFLQSTWHVYIKAMALLWSPTGILVTAIVVATAIIIHQYRKLGAEAFLFKTNTGKAVDGILAQNADLLREKLRTDQTMTESQRETLRNLLDAGDKHRAELAKQEGSYTGLGKVVEDSMRDMMSEVSGAVSSAVGSFGKLPPALGAVGDSMHTEFVGKKLPALTEGARNWAADFATRMQGWGGEVVTKFTGAIAPLSVKMGAELEEASAIWAERMRVLLIGVQNDGKQVYDDFTEPIENIADRLGEIIRAGMDTMKATVERQRGPLMQIWGGLWEEIWGKARTAVEGLSSDIAHNIVSGEGSVLDSFEKLGERLLEIVLETIINRVLNVLLNTISGIIDKLTGVNLGGLGKSKADDGGGGTAGTVGLDDHLEKFSKDSAGGGVEFAGKALEMLLKLLPARTAKVFLNFLFGDRGQLRGPDLMEHLLQFGFGGIAGWINQNWGGFIGGGGGWPPGFPGGGFGGGWKPGDGGGFGGGLGGGLGGGNEFHFHIAGSVWTVRDLAEEVRKEFIQIQRRTGDLGF